MKNVYYTNGHLNDTEGAGLTIASYIIDEATGKFLSAVMQTKDGEPFLGYLPKEVTYEAYLTWANIIKAPDHKVYFPSMFPGIGVVNKQAYEILQKTNKEAAILVLQKEVATNKVNYKLAKLDAEAIGESVEDVFRARCPGVSKEAFETLHRPTK